MKEIFKLGKVLGNNEEKGEKWKPYKKEFSNTHLHRCHG